MFFNRSCNVFIYSVLFCLLSFSKAGAEFDSGTNKTLEKRLHNIYVSHYNRPVLDSDWFKILEAVEVQKHTVQAGDTLWGISKVYFGDGNYWSKLWSVNKGITNPHLIFVGDVIRFTTGSFESTPGIDIEKNSAGDVVAQADGSASISVTDTSASSEDFSPLVPLPAFFEKTRLVERREESPIVFIPRPKLRHKTNFTLVRDILDQPAEVVGEVKSLGQYRMVSAEGSLIMLNAETQLEEGSRYSIIKKSPVMTKTGYPLHLQAIVTVVRKIDNDSLYEGKVIQQFEAIEVGDLISTYKPIVADAEVGGSTGVEMSIRILDEQRTLWSPGDTIFMEAMDGAALTAGDVLKINNKFVDSVEFYVSNGYVKVLSVHPPFATGIIVNSREHVKSNSVSTPTYTGWGVW